MTPRAGDADKKRGALDVVRDRRDCLALPFTVSLWDAEDIEPYVLYLAEFFGRDF